MIIQPNEFDMSHLNDFTIDRFCELIRLAQKSYHFSNYCELPLKEGGILWRHDIDYSLNRALRLAKLEFKMGVHATYFINPHCEFYNPLEKSQAKIIDEILAMGHEIGLHFDADYYDVTSESELDAHVKYEASVLEHFFGVKLSAFSFHNPNEFLLGCDKEQYGGLINCYSSYFRNKVGYCSDSNGYWRYRRLEDVLREAKETKLQVLTHPGWWQEEVMYPRNRILRATEGRAKAVMNHYDDALKEHGRLNVSAESVGKE